MAMRIGNTLVLSQQRFRMSALYPTFHFISLIRTLLVWSCGILCF